jgi:hypothetical protein
MSKMKFMKKLIKRNQETKFINNKMIQLAIKIFNKINLIVKGKCQSRLNEIIIINKTNLILCLQ